MKRDQTTQHSIAFSKVVLHLRGLGELLINELRTLIWIYVYTHIGVCVAWHNYLIILLMHNKYFRESRNSNPNDKHKPEPNLGGQRSIQKTLSDEPTSYTRTARIRSIAQLHICGLERHQCQSSSASSIYAPSCWWALYPVISNMLL